MISLPRVKYLGKNVLKTFFWYLYCTYIMSLNTYNDTFNQYVINFLKLIVFKSVQIRVLIKNVLECTCALIVNVTNNYI